MAPTSTAVFRAVADFASLNRSVKQTRAEIEKLQSQSGKTGDWAKFDSALQKVGDTQKKLRTETKLLNAEQAKLGKSSGTSNLTNALGRLSTATDKARTSTTALSAAQSRQQGLLGQTKTEIGNLASAMKSLSTAEDSATKSAQNHAKSLSDERNSASQKTSVLGKLSDALHKNAQYDRDAASSANSHTEALTREREAARQSTDQHGQLGTSTSAAGKAAQISAGDHDLLAEALSRLTPAASGARDSLRGHADSATEAGNSSRSAASGQSSLADALNRVAPAARNASSGNRDVSTSVREVGSASRSTDGDANRLSSTLGRVGSSSRSSASGTNALSGAMSPLSTSMNAAGNAGQGLRVVLAGLTLASAVPAISLLVGSLSSLVAGLVSVVAAAGPAVGALAALGPAAIAAAGAIGTAMLAFRGVGDALKAMTQAETASGASAGAAAKQRVAAARSIAAAQRGVRDAVQGQADAEAASARSIEDAQRGVESARRDAADAAVDGARRISDAQADLARAERDAADAAVDAARRVEDAQEDLILSQERVLRAEQDLHAARQQAIRDLEDLEERTGDNALSQEGAEIRLLRAQERQQEVNADATSSDLDRREAALAVAEAQDNLSDVATQTTRDQEDLNKAQQGGVDGMPGVVSAQDSLTQAQRSQADAAQSLADAQAAQARSQEDSAERIAAAKQNLTDAETASARAQSDAATRVADAERNLTEAREDAARRQRDAAERVQDALLRLSEAQADAASSSDGASAAASNLAAALAKLSPEGLALVNLLKSLQPELDRMSKAAQTAFFPGLITAIQTLIPLIDSVAMPSIKAFGEALGWVATTAATEIKSWEQDLVDFGTGAGPQLIREFGQILVNLIGAMEDVGVAAIPMLQWLTSLGLRLSEYWEQEAQAGRADGSLNTYFKTVMSTLELLGNILFNTGGIIKEVFAAASPTGVGLLQDFENLTQRTREWMGTAEGKNRMADYFERIKPNVEIILGLLGDLGMAFIKAGESETLTTMLEAIRDKLAPAIERLFKNINESMKDVGPALIQLFTDILDFFSTLSEQGTSGGIAAFIGVLSAFVQGLNALLDVAPFLAPLITGLMGLVGAMMAIKAVGKLTGLTSIAQALNGKLGGGASGPAKAPQTLMQGLMTGAAGKETQGPPKTGTARLGMAAGGLLNRGAGAVGGAVRNAPANATNAFDRRFQTQQHQPIQGPTMSMAPVQGPIKPPPPAPAPKAAGPARGVGAAAPLIDPGRADAAAKALRGVDDAQTSAARSAGSLGQASTAAAGSLGKAGSAAGAAASATAAIGAGADRASDGLRGVGTASEGAAKSVKGVGTASDAAATSSTRAFTGVGAKIGDAFSSAGSATSKAMAGVTGAATSTASKVSGAFSSVADKVGAAVSPTADRVSKAMAPAETKAAAVATKVGAAFSNVAEKVGTAVSPTAARVTTALAPVATAATSAATKVGAAFSGVAEKVGTAVAPIGERISSAFTTGTAGATSAATSISSSVDKVAADSEKSGSRIGNAFRSVGTTISSAAGSITSSFKGVGTAADEAGKAAETAGRSATTAAGGLGTLGTAAASAGGTGGIGGFRGALSGLSGFLGGPWGIAMVAAGVAFSVLSDQMAKSAEVARQSKAAQEGFKTALDTSRGALDANVRSQVQASVEAQTLAGSQNTLVDAANRAGVNVSTMTDAVMLQGPALDSLRSQLQGTIDANTVLVDSTSDTSTGLNSTRTHLTDTGAAASNTLREINGLSAGFQAQQQRSLELRAAINGVTVEQQKLTDAITTQRDQLLASLDADLAKKQSLLDVKSAQETYNAAVQQYGPTSDEAAAADLRLQQTMLQHIAQAGETAAKQAEMNGVIDTTKTRMDAQNQAALELAATHQGPLPEALQKIIDGMSGAELAASGATVKINETGQAVVTLPNGKEIVLTANATDALAKIGQVSQGMFELSNGVTVPIYASVNPTTGEASYGGAASAGRLAGGGVVPGYSPGRDTVPAVLSPGEAVLVPELVNKIGAKNILRANRAASSRSGETFGQSVAGYGPSTAHAAQGVGGTSVPMAFAKGGLVPPAGSVVPNATQRFSLGGVVQRHGGSSYRIKRGDTLAGIAKAYGATVEALAKLNKISNPNKIYEGSWLNLPPKSSGSTTTNASSSDIVKAAQAILDRMNSGQKMYEDWTWSGAPSIVGKYNDPLLDKWGDAVPARSAKNFLQDFIKSSGNTGGDDTGEGPGGATTPDPTASTGMTLEQWAAALGQSNANTKEFESNLLKLSGWGYDDLAIELAKMGVGTGSSSSDGKNGLDLSRQAVKSPSEAAKLEKLLEDSKAVIGDNLESALAIIGSLRKTAGLGIREVATASKIDTKEIFDTLSASDTVLTEVQKLPGANKDKFLSNWDAYKNGMPFAIGGRVPGTGRGDTVPAMLTPGEFVIRKDAASAIGVQGLQKLNQADSIPTQQFAKGGSVLSAEDLFSFVGAPSASRPGVGRGVHDQLAKAAGRSGDTTNSKSVVFSEGAVQVNNPAPMRATDSFENVVRKLSWAGALS